MKVLLDTTCLVAAALARHEHHAATLADLTRRRAAGQTFVLASHAVLEAYAVLTRLPPPHRLTAADAMTVLDRTWGTCETVSLTSSEVWRALRHQAANGIAGGRVYDGHIAACARKGRADVILTWNVRHFESVTDIRVAAPAVLEA